MKTLSSVCVLTHAIKFPVLSSCFMYLRCVVNGPFRCFRCHECLNLEITLLSVLERFAIDYDKTEIKVISTDHDGQLQRAPLIQ